MNSLTSLTARQLRRAADIQERIEALNDELHDLLGTTQEPVNGQAPRAKKRRMSAAGRAAIAAAARARWARIKGNTRSTRKPRRKMSPAVKSRLAEIARARWKKVKAQGKTTL
jgi:hypothetical protein